MRKCVVNKMFDAPKAPKKYFDKLKYSLCFQNAAKKWSKLSFSRSKDLDF